MAALFKVIVPAAASLFAGVGVFLNNVELTLSVFYLAFTMCPGWINDQVDGYVFQFFSKLAIYSFLGNIGRGYLCAKPLLDLHSP